MPKPKTNVALRQWARGVSFTIAMGRRQVYTLIALHISSENSAHGPMVGNAHRFTRHFVTSVRKLEENGLVNPHVWHSDEKRRKMLADTKKYKHKNFYQVTTAGLLIIGLLQEAGIYEEVREELINADRLRLRIA